MNVLRKLLIGAFAVLLCGCDPTTYHEEETGYKGKARVDSYLAATRFLEHYGYHVANKPGWQKPELKDAVLIVPTSVLKSRGLIDQLDYWTLNGGHLICLVERAESIRNDWNDHYFPKDDLISEAFKNWLEAKGLHINLRDSGKALDTDKVTVDGKVYETFVEARNVLTRDGGKTEKVFDSIPYGSGRVSILADARPLRNRYVGDHENASILLSLAEWTGRDGGVLIIRNASISFWSMLWDSGWPALLGLALLVILWLWKNFPTFGPLKAVDEPSKLRSYDQHLEALGDFHWRLDKAYGLLRPLRESIQERALQLAIASGSRDANLFEWLGQRTSLPLERVQRAMTQEQPPDAATFTRLMADLQTLHLSLS